MENNNRKCKQSSMIESIQSYVKIIDIVSILVVLSYTIVTSLNYAQACSANWCNFQFPPRPTGGNPSPLKQLLAGKDPQNVYCNGDFQLVLKRDGRGAACVTMQTAIKLQERGWGMIFREVYN
jgi:hypothetical protein